MGVASTEQVAAWLRMRSRGWGLSNAAFGTLWLLVGCLVLAITFLVIRMVATTTASQWGVRLPDGVVLLISFGAMVLLFIGNARTSDEYLTDYSLTTGTATDDIVTICVPGFGTTSNVNPLAPDSFHSIVKILSAVLFIGPRLVVFALRLFGKAWRLLALDMSGCASVIALLAGRRGHLVPYEVIAAELPWLRLPRVIAQLRAVDGVLFLWEKRPGLALNSDLKAALEKLS